MLAAKLGSFVVNMSIVQPQQVDISLFWGCNPRIETRSLTVDASKDNVETLQMYRTGGFGFILLSGDAQLTYATVGSGSSLTGASSGDCVGTWLEPKDGMQFTITRCLYYRENGNEVVACILTYPSTLPPE